MSAYRSGFCTRCGSYDLELTAADGDALLCDECLESGDYTKCDSCARYYSWNAVRFFHMRSGNTLCENCVGTQDIDEDEITGIEDHTSYAEFDYVNLTDGRKG